MGLEKKKFRIKCK